MRFDSEFSLAGFGARIDEEISSLFPSDSSEKVPSPKKENECTVIMKNGLIKHTEVKGSTEELFVRNRGHG